MSAAKHTPGPWAWEEGQGDIKREWNGKKWTVATVSGCDLGWHEDRTCEGREAGANARLIAAAPELLEAVKKARACIHLDKTALADAHTNHEGLDEDGAAGVAEYDAVLALIDAAIAMATGSAA